MVLFGVVVIFKYSLLLLQNLVLGPNLHLFQVFANLKKIVFSLIDVLLKFPKYLRSVLVPRTVISTFMGFVLYLGKNFSCLMTGSRF